MRRLHEESFTLLHATHHLHLTTSVQVTVNDRLTQSGTGVGDVTEGEDAPLVVEHTTKAAAAAQRARQREKMRASGWLSAQEQLLEQGGPRRRPRTGVFDVLPFRSRDRIVVRLGQVALDVFAVLSGDADVAKQRVEKEFCATFRGKVAADGGAGRKGGAKKGGTKGNKGRQHVIVKELVVSVSDFPELQRQAVWEASLVLSALLYCAWLPELEMLKTRVEKLGSRWERKWLRKKEHPKSWREWKKRKKEQEEGGADPAAAEETPSTLGSLFGGWVGAVNDAADASVEAERKAEEKKASEGAARSPTGGAATSSSNPPPRRKITLTNKYFGAGTGWLIIRIGRVSNRFQTSVCSPMHNPCHSVFFEREKFRTAV